jgi:hypothetical protein
MPKADETLPRFRRAEARKAGLMYYFTGKPCPKGHVARRLTTTAHCTECDVLKRQANRAKHAARMNNKYNNDPEFRAREQERMRQRGKTPEFKAYRREYQTRRYRGDPAFREMRKAAVITDRRNGKSAKYNHLYLGVSQEEFLAMLKSQKNLCAICENVLDGGRHTHLDHNHETGRIRGILCRGCNHGIGHFRDNAEIMRNAIQYLENYSD